MKKEFSKLENWFLILTLLFGVIFAILVPPNQVPDEDRHFARVYAILDGNLTTQKVELPQALYDLLPNYFAMPELAKKFEIQSYLANISSKSDYSETREFSPATSYSPLLYFPQLLGIALGKLLGLNAHELFILGRIFSLFLYIGAGYFILKSTPVAKKGLFVFLTMPMNIYMAASYSADTVQLCLSLVYLHMIVANLNSTEPLNKKEIATFLLVAVLLSLTKPVSLVLILLSLAIPLIRFGSLQKKLIFAASQIGFGLIVTFLWTRGIATNISPTLDTISPAQQLVFILFNPIPFIKAIFTSLSVNAEFYFYSFVGYFGWLTAPLPNFVYFIFVIILCLVLLLDTNTTFTITNQQKYVFLSVFFLYLVGLFFIMYLYSSPPGAEAVGGVQGRYFGPIFPLLLYVAASINKPKIYMGSWLGALSFGLLVPVILFFSVLTIYQKFFVICGEQYFSYNGKCKLPTTLPNERPIGEILQPVTQTFTSECNDVNGVGVLFGTYARENHGSLNISLHDETSNTRVFQERIKVNEIEDNTWLYFEFSTVRNVKDHEFELTFRPRGSSPGNAVTIWATASDIYAQGELLGFDGHSDIVFQYMCPFGLINDIH